MIDLDKPVQTRDGRKVLIYNRNAGGDYPIHGAIEYDPDIYTAEMWGERGNYSTANRHYNDLVNVPKKHLIWLNIYNHARFPRIRYGFASEDDAIKDRLKCGLAECLATIPVEYYEGQGLGVTK